MLSALPLAETLLAQALIWACLWDADTLATESRGLPEVVRILTGRFERNPPLYYEMRLARATGRVAADPGDLEAYDDAGVACDRLGRGDEAIAWMDKKRAQLDRPGAGVAPGALKEHRYRYLANVGTFWVHRWARDGADRSRLDEVRTARDFIAEALELNPDAHFGRERYQLLAMEWILEPAKAEPYYLPSFLDGRPGAGTPDEQVRGLTGLIALGNAWESVDIFNALIPALSEDGDRSALAYLARLRCEELIDQGRGSMLPGAPTGRALKEIVQRPESMPTSHKLIETEYRRLRAEADSWHAQRTAYMLQRLEQGRHPDTDPTFWKEYHDPGPPALAVNLAPRVARVVRGRLHLLIGGLVLAAAALTGMAVLRRSRARRKAPTRPLSELA